MTIRWHNHDLELAIIVQPNAKKTQVVGLYQSHIKIQITALAIDNKANLYLLKWLATEFGVAKKCVSIAQGTQSRFKKIRIQAPTIIPQWLKALEK